MSSSSSSQVLSYPSPRPTAPRGWLRAFLGLLLGLYALTPALHALDPKSKWVQARTEYVEVLSDASQKDATEFAVQYSAFRHTLQEMLGPTRKLPRSTVLLFRNKESFGFYFPSDDKDLNLVSVSSDVDGEPLLAQALDYDREQALRMAFEFETTWALPRLGYYLPIWASQGTGKVFSTFAVKRGVCVLGDYESFAMEYWTGSPLPWSRFFAINVSSAEYRDLKKGSYHSQMWSLMHYLWLSDDKGSERFAQLAKLLRSTTDLKAIETVLGLTEKELTTRVQRHVRRSAKVRELKFDEAGLRARLETGPVSHATVSLRLADLLLVRKREGQATLEINAARAQEPENPRVREVLARAALYRRDGEEAMRLYREAIALKSTNLRAHLLSAENRLNLSMSRGSDEAGGGGVFADEAIAEVRRAIELDPNNDHAYRLLARALYVRPEITEEHIAELAPGVALGDPQGTIRLYRALLYTRLKKTAEYTAELEALAVAPGVSATVSSEVESRLVPLKFNALIDRVQILAREGKFAEARAEFKAFSETVSPRSPVAKRLSQIEKWIDTAEQQAARK